MVNALNVFFACLLVVTILLEAALTLQVYRRRHLLPIRVRNPSLLLVGQSGFFLAAFTTSLSLSDPDNFPCSFYITGLFIGIGVGLSFHLVSVLVSSSDFRIQRDSLALRTRVDDNAIQDILIAHYKRNLKKYSGRAYSLITFVFVAIVVGFTIFPDYAVEPVSQQLCIGGFPITNILLLWYIPGLVVVVKILKILDSIEDDYGLSRELKFNVFGFIIMIVILFLCNFRDDVFFATHPIFGVVLPSIYIMIVKMGIPLKLSYNPQYDLSHRTRGFSLEPVYEANAVHAQFVALLEDPKGNDNFRNFLVTEFSAENMLFYNSVNAYEQRFEGDSPDGDIWARRRSAIEVYDVFCDNAAPLVINIPYRCRNELTIFFKDFKEEQNSTDIPRGIFNRARKDIFELMKNDSFPRFRFKHPEHVKDIEF